MSEHEVAMRISRVRVATSFVIAVAVHAMLLLARVPVGSPRVFQPAPEIFELVDAVVVEDASASDVAAATPIETVEPSPTAEPALEAEEPLVPQDTGAATEEPTRGEQVSEAAVMAAPEVGEQTPQVGAGSSISALQFEAGPGAGDEPARAPPGDAAVSTAGGTPASPAATEEPFLPFYKVDTKPQFVRRGELRYPEAARRLGLTGTVVIEVDIDATGSVRAARVTTPAGHGFDDAAVDMVRASTFTPARAGGRDVPVRARFTVTFRLG